jgi:hypothetical protein
MKGETTMNNYNLVEHDNGPGIAATVVLNLLLDELVKKKLLSHGDVARLLSSADGTVERMGEINHAVRDARSVLNKMRGI